jgi:hypothetical protein
MAPERQARSEVCPKARLDGGLYAIENTNADTSVVVTSSQLGTAFKDWFAPQCSGCTRTP